MNPMSQVVICPTITAFDKHEYRAQMERIQPFARRVHIDLMDGVFAPTKSPGLGEVWWPEALVADIHLMYQRPMEQVDKLTKLKPNLVVIHQEASVDHTKFAQAMHASGIKAGLAILSGTPVSTIVNVIQDFDQVLVFSGDLGKHGGVANLGLLDKVRQLRDQYPQIDIAWDGGISDRNAKQLAEAGVDVLNVGGFIQKADDPAGNYGILARLTG